LPIQVYLLWPEAGQQSLKRQRAAQRANFAVDIITTPDILIV
jgi:hypothetical protein